MPSFRKDLYPFTGRYLDLDGLAMHYLDEGQGDPVLLLHGNPTWSFYYRNLVAGLRGSHRVVAPDHIGCGWSDKPDARRYPFTLERRVQDIEALTARLGFTKPITLVMHDWGGMIGMAYATRHPEQIGRLVLLNTAAFHLPAKARLPLSLRLCRNTCLDDFLIRRTGLFTRLTLRWGVRRPLSKAVRDAYLLPHDAPDKRLANLQFVRDIPLVPADPSYALISSVQERVPIFRKTPSLILWGDHDFVFTQPFLETWQTLLPNAQVRRFPNAGHLLLEDAGEEILPILRQFLAGRPAGG